MPRNCRKRACKAFVRDRRICRRCKNCVGAASNDTCWIHLRKVALTKTQCETSIPKKGRRAKTGAAKPRKPRAHLVRPEVRAGVKSRTGKGRVSTTRRRVKPSVILRQKAVPKPKKRVPASSKPSQVRRRGNGPGVKSVQPVVAPKGTRKKRRRYIPMTKKDDSFLRKTYTGQGLFPSLIKLEAPIT